MPRSRRRLFRSVRPAITRRNWRQALLRIVSGWNRYQVGRVIGAVVLLWLIGPGGLYLAEGHRNAPFGTIGESLWNVWARCS